jgi:hypothetical protein
MPTQNARKHTIPTGAETSVTPETIFETFGNSIRDVVPVANVTERSLLVQALTNAEPSQAPTAARPLVVLRADAPGLSRIEYTTDGSVWIAVTGLIRFASKSDADSWALSNGALLSGSDRALVNGVPYVWSGTAWVRSAERAITTQKRKGGVQDGFSSTFSNALSVTLADAPAGRYRLEAVAVTYSNEVATHLKSARYGGVSADVGTGTPLDGPGDWIQNWPSNVHCKQTDVWFFTWGGGDLPVHLDVAITAGGLRAATDGCRLALQYLGLP